MFYEDILVLGIILFFCLITTIAWLGAPHQSLPLSHCCFVLCTKKQLKERNNAAGTVPITGTSAHLEVCALLISTFDEVRRCYFEWFLRKYNGLI